VSRAATKPQSGRSHKPSQHLDPREQLPLLQSHPRFFLPIPVFPGGVFRGKVVDVSSWPFSDEIVTTRRAFEGKSQLSVFTAILEKEPETITTSQPLAPPTLDRVVFACLAKDPADRFQSAHNVATGLRWMADSTPTESTKISPQFNKSWTAVLAALLLAFVALGAFGGYRWARSSEETVSIHAEIPPRQVFHGHYRRFWRHARPFATGRQDRLRCSFW
jgi:hypothetical protein